MCTPECGGAGGGGALAHIGFPLFSQRNGKWFPLSDVARPSERLVGVCDPQMPGNHGEADQVASWLRTGSLCSEVRQIARYAAAQGHAIRRGLKLRLSQSISELSRDQLQAAQWKHKRVSPEALNTPTCEDLKTCEEMWLFKDLLS